MQRELSLLKDQERFVEGSAGKGYGRFHIVDGGNSMAKAPRQGRPPCLQNSKVFAALQARDVNGEEKLNFRPTGRT